LSFKIGCLLLPIYYLLYSTKPDQSTFDVKKELKRVLRADNLPDSHPDKPKTFLGKLATKAAASLLGETATALGYSVRFNEILWCLVSVEVKLVVEKRKLVWVGLCNKWYYVGAWHEEGEE